MAVENGYDICEIYEIYQYQVTQFNPDMVQGGLFADYINKFLKLKTMAIPAVSEDPMAKSGI